MRGSKIELSSSNQLDGPIRIGSAHQKGQRGATVVIGRFSGRQPVMGKHLLRVWPEDGTVAPGLLDNAEQVIVGFFLKPGEDLLAQPAVVFQIQPLGTGDVMSGGRTRVQSSGEQSAKSRTTLLWSAR